MKKIFISVLSLAIFSGITQSTVAQEDKLKESKEEEIVIRKNGDKDAKVTVEMKGDDILINGKPLSEFKDDDIAVIKRKKITRNGNKVFMMPGEGNDIFLNDGIDNEDTRPFLGVTTDRSDNGVKILKVAKGSAAEKAGLKEGDIITKIASKKINDPEELMDVVKSYKPKDEIKIYYKRDGKSNDTKATLGERKESIVRSFHFNKDEGPEMNEKMFKNFNFRMPPMDVTPGQPFNKFWMGPNKKLGVRIEDTENNAGAKITNVEEGSVAEKAGLKKDDIITEVDGKKIENVSDARDEILETDKSNYTIKAKRNGTVMNFEIKIPKKANSADL
jgi:serine protease Do